MIQLENVEKSYGTNRVLKGISLAIAQGEFVSITGSSGSGKSTLLNLIGGMDRPDNGKILVDGAAISSYNDEQLTVYRRNQIGFIFQFFNLLPNITVFENVLMPLLLNGRDDESSIFAMIDHVGLKGKEHAYPYQLSGGEQQRVAIARALIHNPRIILADEPTGSLDSETGKAIMELIRKLKEETGKTVILVTHEAYIAEYAQRAFQIRDGMILQ
ncbi:MAG: ABC transporter ATP-binding protein [Thermodesulfovibrionales bacterium]|nr:ABC transporter ATP-binding protein [Thermodesulfovibrionales bacterium]